MGRAFQIEFKRGIYAAGFYIGILLLIAAGLIGAGDAVSYVMNTGLPEGEVRFLSITYQAISSETFSFMIPVACTLAMGASYVEDLQGGLLYYIMLRSTKKRYRWSKVINCALFGSFIAMASILFLFLLFLVIFFPNHAELQRLLAMETGYTGFFLEKIVILCLNGALYSLLGGVIAAFTSNRYMAYAAPFIFYYVLSTLFAAYLPDFPLVNPREWLLVQQSWIVGVLLLLAAVNVLAVFCYLKLIERSGDHG